MRDDKGKAMKDDRGKVKYTDTTKLGSTLMETMLNEVSDFCDPKIKENWLLKPHQQVFRYQANDRYYCVHVVISAYL